ncbi:MAG: FtsW/RodA/SpoVE family cell cycle protein [Synechococcus sp.]|nr:FtsW/RodA/SpoVE family cell cycle protein [Synechococcus sp.]
MPPVPALTRPPSTALSTALPPAARSRTPWQLLPLPWSEWPAEARLLVGLTLVWSLLGLLVLSSASSFVAQHELGDATYFIKRQLLWLIAGWSLLLLASRTTMRRWLQLAAPALIVGTLMIAATLTVGSVVMGSSRWLVIGPLQIQPSELIKPFIVLQGALLFSQWRRLGIDRRLLWLGLFTAVILLVLKQPNLSTAALIGLGLWLLALAAGLPLAALAGAALAGGLLGLASIVHNPYQLVRVTGFLNPWQDARDSGYQLVQSLLAIGSGGMLGQGLGLSTQKLQYLPIQSTDFIFAVFAEECGFVGSLLLLLFLMIYGFVGLRIALSCRSPQHRLVAIGCIILLLGQSILNIAVASGAMPTTGLPLPLISYGGNSLLSSLFLVGLLLRCALEAAAAEPPGPASPRQPASAPIG